MAKDKKAYIDEAEFNQRVIAEGFDNPANDSPDDSDSSALREMNMGVDNLAEDEDDELVGFMDLNDQIRSEPGPRLEQVRSSNLPSPREDENSDTSEH